MGGIAIVMTYFNRLPQLQRTIRTIRETTVTDYDIVIVDDASPEKLEIEGDRIHLLRIEPEWKRWINEDVASNTGLRYAISNLEAEKIIIQNPECFHVGDVIRYTGEHLTDENYIAFGAFSISQKITENPDIDIHQIIAANNRSARFDHDNGWYNHSIHRASGYYFCGALTAANFRKLNGFDERLADGLAYQDDHLKWRIKQAAIRVEIVDSPFVVHQWHPNGHPHPNATELIRRNANLYNEFKKTKEFKAVHIYSPDL